MGAQCPIDEAGMEIVFTQDYLALLGQSSYDRIIGLKSGPKENCLLFAHKVGQLLFQLHVDMQRPVQEP